MKTDSRLALAKKIYSDLAIIIPKDKLALLADLVEDADFQIPSRESLSNLGLPTKVRNEMMRSLTNAQRDDLLALTMAIRSRVDDNESDPIEICCTGKGLGRECRSTWPALSDLLESAEDRIMIVGYDVRPGFKEIFDVIERKAVDGVRIDILVDDVGDKKELMKWFDRTSTNVQMWHRPKGPEKDISKLHIKCIIIDNRVCMFGSANLTYSGLKTNIEMNLIIREKVTISEMQRILGIVRSGLEPCTR